MKPNYALSLLALCCLAIAEPTTCPCGQASKKQNGKENFPFVVRVVTANNNRTLCTAAILTDRHLVTSVHCTRLIGKQPVVGIIGDGSGEVKTVKISKYQEHSGFNAENSMNDIAVLFLESPLKFSESVMPVCMSDDGSGGGIQNLIDQKVEIIGWVSESSSLKKIGAKISSTQPCREIFPEFIPSVMFPTQMCTFPEEGACIKNMGSPVVYLEPKINKYVLVGIVSYGKAECNPKFPTVETEVSVYLRWIKSVVKSPLCHEKKSN